MQRITNSLKRPITLLSVLLLLVPCLWSLPIAGFAPAQAAIYEADPPESVLTDDIVETELLGTLDFFDGMPSEATVQKTYDFIDVSRGVDAFLNGIPAASIYAMLEGLIDEDIQPGDVGIFEGLMNARSLFLTANSTTMYVVGEANVKDGPIVLEIPPGILGTIDDAYFRYVTDVGNVGPDQGQGGKYLLVNPDYDGEIPEEVDYVVTTPSYRNWLFFRGFIEDGDLAGTADAIKSVFRTYPLAEASNPPEQRFVNLTDRQMNTIHANDYQFFEELNAVIQYEPADAFDPELLGQFAAIGIKKGQPFAPDERMKNLLTEAVKIGNAAARSISFSPRKESVYIYPDERQWISFYPGDSHEFFDNGERVLDDRILFHYMITGVSPSLVSPPVGSGSVYGMTARDSAGDYLEGDNTYSVTLPNPIPVNNFWALTVYSGQHRSMLETDQKTAGLDSNNPSVKANPDGSYTMWFGPEAPIGHEGNWIQTMPGKSYIAMLRLYGPLEPWFDQTWIPGDLELVQ
ncbi:MAG: DUF1254 domain-containing protein [Okeania sp. SIO2C2]|nr:DUF1254 domain-containing protein [Okeania sp. SIO2C2]